MNLSAPEAGGLKDVLQLLIASLSQVHEAMVRTDELHRVVMFNGAAEALWACSSDQVANVPLHCLLGQVLHDPAPMQTMRAGPARDVRIQRADGSHRPATMSLSRIVCGNDAVHLAHFRDTSDQQDRHEHLRQLSLVAENSHNAIFVSSPESMARFVNDGFTRMFGYRLEDMAGRRPLHLLSGPHTDPVLEERLQKCLRAAQCMSTEVQLYARDGRPVWVSAAVNPVLDDSGAITAVVTVLTDITQTKMHQVLHHKVLDAMVGNWNLADVLALICREVEHIAPEILSLVSAVDCDGMLRPLAGPNLPTWFLRSIDGVAIGPRNGPDSVAAWRGQAVLVTDVANDPLCARKAAQFLSIGLAAVWSNPIKSSDSRVLGTLSFHYREPRGPDELHVRLAEICLHLCALALERKQTSERVHQLAYFDPLTDLPNRTMFSAKAEQALAGMTTAGETSAVLFIDLDRFKRVNDAQGHVAGDQLLRDIARRLAAELPAGSLLGRHAGDEFVALLPRCSAELAGSRAERLLGAVSAPTRSGEIILHPSASIGVAMFPEDGADIELLVRHADMGMHRAKCAGGGRFSFFSHDMDLLAQERVTLETALIQAMLLDQLTLQYQPQMRVTEAGLVLYGVEALARWSHPELGIVSPQRFVAVAEEAGLIDQLGIWALRSGCAQMADWQQRGIKVPRLSVNMSPLNFRDRAFASVVASTLAEYAINPGAITLEMTEGVMLDPSPDVLGNIEAIYAQGVCLSLDDFGTGYSSLSHLHRLPISELKLDKSFVRDIDTSAIARTLTTSVLRIGESLRLTVVAEGVETPSQLEFLAGQGCAVVQGYLLSRPLRPCALEQWLLDNQHAGLGKTLHTASDQSAEMNAAI